jgi:hypothetical protein
MSSSGLRQRTKAMKHILSGVAIATALALSAAAWAQQGAAPAPTMSDQTSATPSKHRHARTVHHASHGTTATHMPASAAGGNNVANQLNQQELSHLQAGSSMPPTGSPTMAGPGPMAGRGLTSSSRTGGPKSSGSGYVPPTPGAGMSPPPHSPPLVGTTPGGNP